jgi:urease accessory protein
MAASHRAHHPLVRASAVLGNAAEGNWTARLRGSRIDVLALDPVEAQRSRFRKSTTGGIDVAIGLERDVQLRDGDVLAWDDASQTAVVVRVDLPDVMVVDLSALMDGSAETLLARSVELGHALGNQHWPMLAKEARVYVPVAISEEAMEAVMEAHRLAGVSWWFARGADVQPYLAPDEARLLFANQAGHAHEGAGPGVKGTK